MIYDEAINLLRRKQLKPVYLLAGAEPYRIQQFLKELLQILNPDGNPDALHSFDGTADLKAILQAANTSPFFSERNIIIAKGLKFFTDKPSEKDKRDQQQLINYLENIPDFSVLIFISQNKPDKRRKFSKALSKYGTIVECDPIPPWKIDTWLNQQLRQLHLRLDREAYIYLSEAVKAMNTISLGFIAQELNKLTLCSSSRQIDRRTLETNLSSIPEISIYRLWDLLCDKNLPEVFILYDIQKGSGDKPIGMIAFIAKQMRRLWQFKVWLSEGKTIKQIASETKLPPFIVEKITKQARSFSTEKITQTIQLIAEADYKLKKGLNEPAMIENIFITFCT